MISKEETKQIQGAAILAMCCLHLFCTLTPQFTPLIYVSGVPLTYFFGQAADYCVMAYCFCSGYGLMACYTACQENGKPYFRGRCKSLLRFLQNYWIILFLFAGVSLLIGKGETWLGSPLVFLGNFATLWSSYNGAWWFVSTYLFMVLLSPLVFRWMQKYPKLVGLLSIPVYVISYLVRFKEDQSFFIQHLVLLGMSYAELMIGAYFYQYRCMERISKCWNRIMPARWRIPVLTLLAVMVIVVRRFAATLFVAPISGLVFIVSYLLAVREKPWIGKPFAYLGKHSMNIWLVHMFFYMPQYGGISYYAKYPLAVLFLLLLLSILASYCVKALQSGVDALQNVARKRKP